MSSVAYDCNCTQLVVGTGDGLQRDRASSVGAPHVVLGGSVLAKVNKLGEVGSSKGEQKDGDGDACTESASLSLRVRMKLVSVVKSRVYRSRLTAVKPEDPDKTPVLALEAPELAGTFEDVLFPPPPRVRVLVVTFSHV